MTNKSKAQSQSKNKELGPGKTGDLEPTPKKVTINGYSFGERTLEGIMFEATIVNNKVVAFNISSDDDGKYWDGLNKEKWLKIGKEFAEHHWEDYDEAAD